MRQVSSTADSSAAVARPRKNSHSELKELFSAAHRQYAVPQSILEATAYVATHWTMVENHEHDHMHGQAPAFGVMALRGTRLKEAVDLSGIPEREVKFNARSNIFAAAAWFSNRAKELNIDREQGIEAWSPVVADFAGLSTARERWSYVDQEVFAVLRRGVSLKDPTNPGQMVSIEAIPDLKTGLTPAPVPFTAGPDYAHSVWRPTGNHDARPSGNHGTPQMVIIHSCEGGYVGCLDSLSRPSRQVSAHYVVNSNGSEISQIARNHRRAWHIRANYDCSLNDNVLCELNGVQSNDFTIGIEHAGFASQDSWDDGLIEASAQLVCAITEQHNIPRDAEHIVSHGLLQANRTDPGENWPWQYYIERIRHHCGDDATDGTSIIVDNDNIHNDTQLAQTFYSGNWQASSASTGFWGSDYRFASTVEKSDGFQFSFYLDQDEVRTVEARWTAANNRSSSAPFVVFDSMGNVLETVYVDQRTGAGRWNRLGQFNFTQGWNHVILSRWTSSPEVVVADAIRVR